MFHYLEFCEPHDGTPLIDPDIAYKSYFGNTDKQPAVTAAETLLNLMRHFLKNNKPKDLLPVIKINGGEDLIPLICADALRPTNAEIFGITDVFLPWQMALS